jgi:hypothetical protein
MVAEHQCVYDMTREIQNSTWMVPEIQNSTWWMVAEIQRTNQEPIFQIRTNQEHG